MSKSIFITATGTDVGKTYVTALIIKKMRAAGYQAGYYKAALSGAEATGNALLPGDADYVNRTAAIGERLENMVSYVYKTAVSPHLAAQLEGNPVELSQVLSDFACVSSQYEYVTVEGSGGIVCPLRYDDTQHIFLVDIIKSLQLAVLIVADAGLGTINAVVLTIEYLKQRNIPVKGIILNHYHQGNMMEEDNRKMITEITGVPVIALVENEAENLDIDVQELLAIYE
ncbi:dethiobiotin synthase [Syntrophomonas curvata]